MLNKEQIDNILEPTIEGLGFEFVCSEVANSGSAKFGGILRVFIDSEQGVTLDDCTKVTRQLGRVLDVESDITSKYSLEISSPGLDRPLVKPQHFKKHIGSKVKVKLNIPKDFSGRGSKQKNVVGLIQELAEDSILVVKDLDHEDLSYKIELDNIMKANLVPEWD